MIGWQPNDDVEEAYYLIVGLKWDELVKLGEPAVESLIKVLEDKEKYVRVGQRRPLWRSVS